MHPPHELKFGSITGLKMMTILVLGLILPPGGKAFKYLICIGSCTEYCGWLFMCRAMSDRSFQHLLQSSEPRNVSGNEACVPNKELITCCFAPQPGLCSKRLITVISAAARGLRLCLPGGHGVWFSHAPLPSSSSTPQSRITARCILLGAAGLPSAGWMCSLRNPE